MYKFYSYSSNYNEKWKDIPWVVSHTSIIMVIRIPSLHCLSLPIFLVDLSINRVIFENYFNLFSTLIWTCHVMYAEKNMKIKKPFKTYYNVCKNCTKSFTRIYTWYISILIASYNEQYLYEINIQDYCAKFQIRCSFLLVYRIFQKKINGKLLNFYFYDISNENAGIMLKSFLNKVDKTLYRIIDVFDCYRGSSYNFIRQHHY